MNPLRRKGGAEEETAPPLMLDTRFGSLADWQEFAAANPTVIDPSANDLVAARIQTVGFAEPLTGRSVAPGDIGPSAGNWREELVANSLNSRMRATLLVLEDHLRGHDPNRVRIFATEGVTALALVLRGRFPKFLGAEYAMDDAAAQELYPVPHEDLMGLTAPSDVFDLVTTNEVLEHVPDLDRGLSEMARVLRPGGWHVGTHPFRFSAQEGDLRARLVDGEIEHLQPPEIHGNPVDPGGGSLVFETPGWNILERAREAGFSEAFMRFVADERRGVLTDVGGVFVFCAQK